MTKSRYYPRTPLQKYMRKHRDNIKKPGKTKALFAGGPLNNRKLMVSIGVPIHYKGSVYAVLQSDDLLEGSDPRYRTYDRRIFKDFNEYLERMRQYLTTRLSTLHLEYWGLAIKGTRTYGVKSATVYVDTVDFLDFAKSHKKA